ncbi:DNA polymerase beta-like isoform 3-T7 [Alca torda]
MLEQPICSKPDKHTRSPLRRELLVEDVRSGSHPGEKHYCRVPHFTSSDIFNKNIRIHAVEMGFAINVPLSHPLGVTAPYPLFIMGTGQNTLIAHDTVGLPFTDVLARNHLYLQRKKGNTFPSQYRPAL